MRLPLALVIPALAQEDSVMLQLSKPPRGSQHHRYNVDTSLQAVAAMSSHPMKAADLLEKLAKSVSNGETTIDEESKTLLEGMKKEFTETVEPSITDAHDKDIELLKNIVDSSVASCSTGHKSNKAEAVREGQTVAVKENVHKTCRDELKQREDDRDSKCAAFETFRAGLSAPPRCDVPGSTDELISYLEDGMRTFSQANLDQAKAKDQACKDATAAASNKLTECNSHQATYESSFCQWRVEVHETCHTYKDCYEITALDLDFAAEKVEKDAEGRKLEWDALQKIKCFIDVLISDDEIADRKEAVNQCRDFAPDLSHLDFEVPALPVPDSCDLVQVAEYPCTESYLSRYDGMSGIASCTTCAALEPHLELASSEWKLVMRQTAPTWFGRTEWSKNSQDPDNANYAIMDQLESFRASGKFKFKLHWPNSGLEDQVWEQTSNPTSGGAHGGVEGYKAISAPHTSNRWAGLERGGGASLLDGSVSHGNWYYAVGSHHGWGGGIPGPASAVQVVELYVHAKESAGVWTTLYSKGSFGESSSSKETFNKLFRQAGSGIVRRQCTNCVSDLQDVYFKRKTDVSSWDAYDNLLVTWRDAGFHTDFDIYPTYDDAVADTNAFQFCNGNDPGVAFPRDCGPNGFIGGQWTSLTRGGQSDYVYSTVAGISLHKREIVDSHKRETDDDCTGWSVGTHHDVDGTCYMGAFDNSHQRITKTFSGFRPGCTYKWTAVIDTWASVDNEQMILTVNGDETNFQTRGAGACSNGWTEYENDFGDKVGSHGSSNGGWKDCWKNFEKDFIVPEDGNANVDMYFAINQHINDEGWGWHDMRFERLSCPSMPSIDKLDDDCSGWSVGTHHNVDGKCFMGAFDNNHQRITKTFSGLQAHCTYKWKAVIDTWASVDNEQMILTVNGDETNFQTRGHNACSNGWTEYAHDFGDKVGSHGSSNGGWKDCWKNFEKDFVVPEDGNANVDMYFAINQHINDEGWGWHDMTFEKVSCS
jgi:hypothetical protein